MNVLFDFFQFSYNERFKDGEFNGNALKIPLIHIWIAIVTASAKVSNAINEASMWAGHYRKSNIVHSHDCSLTIFFEN